MKKYLKPLLIVASILLFAFALLLLTSHYEKNRFSEQRAIYGTVEINAPVERVFKYMSRSDWAGKWSVFVHHITPLNADKVADGAKGCIRRCFVNSDETGTQWDEEILNVTPNKNRTLSVYALKGFPITSEGLITQQIYEPIDSTHTRLTLILAYGEPPSLWEQLKTHIASYKTHSIFEANLANIKRNIESLTQPI